MGIVTAGRDDVCITVCVYTWVELSCVTHACAAYMHDQVVHGTFYGPADQPTFYIGLG